MSNEELEQMASAAIADAFAGWTRTKPSSDEVPYLENLADYLFVEFLTALRASEASGLARVAELENIVNIQCADGNWDYDEYMHGMANGLILALAILKNEEPKFKVAPEKWGREKTTELREEVSALSEIRGEK